MVRIARGGSDDSDAAKQIDAPRRLDYETRLILLPIRAVDVEVFDDASSS